MAKFCTNCGATLEDDKKFCTECGVSVADAPVGAAEPVAVPVGAAVGSAAPPIRQAPTPAAAPVMTAAPPQAVPQPAYQTVAYGDAAPPPGSKYDPITTGGYIGIMLLMCIPLVGFILTIVWACGGCKKINKRNLARATLIMMVIGLVISLILGFAVRALIGKVTDTIEQETGISISGGKDSSGGALSGLLGGSSGGSDGSGAKDDSGAKGNSSGLSGLAGLIGGLAGDGDKSITNKDIEALEELEGLLGGLSGGDESGLGKLIDGAQDINREAEAANDGWPASLRKYPGGTATATASYRTEITGTTQEEMMSWIEQLKGDGFQYQDFYDFGMTEADMLSMNGWWATDGKIYLSLSYSDGTVIVDHTKELPDLSGLLGN